MLLLLKRIEHRKESFHAIQTSITLKAKSSGMVEFQSHLAGKANRMESPNARTTIPMNAEMNTEIIVISFVMELLRMMVYKMSRVFKSSLLE